MAFDAEELKRRREAREAQRRKDRLMVRMQLATVIVVILVAVAGLVWMIRDNAPAPKPTEPQVQVTEPKTEPPTEAGTDAPEATAPGGEIQNVQSPTTVIHLAAAGDLNIHDTTVAAGKTGSGYDYTEVFLDVAPVFAGADLAVLNFEGNLVGAPYGTKSQSAPQELAEAVQAMGVDLVQAANSCSVTHGVKGLATTLDNLRDAGLEPLGAFADPEEFQRAKGYTVVDVQGVRIAFVAFTKGVGGLSLPAGSEDCVNLLYTDYATTYQEIDKDGISRILSNVAMEKPDLTVALVHWGSEYKDMVTKNQESIAGLMHDSGVDVILGTHSHMLHQIDYEPVSGRMTAYSLGDFYGEAERAGTNYSVILDLEITKDHASGDTRVTDYSYTPIYTLTEDDSPDGQRRVVRLRHAVGAFDADFVNKVSQAVYEDMNHALERIADRIAPETEE